MVTLKEQITKSCTQILRPLVRILLRHGISHSEFVEITKRAYVDVAFNDFAIPDKPKTVSHAAVVTGLSRKEVLRIQKISDIGLSPVTNHINRASRVVGGWLKDSEFLDENEKPLVLPLKGKTASFDVLVKRYSGDITWGAVLDEMIRVETVTLTEDNKVKLVQNSYIPNKDELQKFYLMGECGTDFFETFSHNLNDKLTSTRLQRSVAYNYIPTNKVKKFEKLAKEQSDKLLIKLNKWLAQENCPLQNQDKNTNYERVGLGVYYFNNDARGESTYETEHKK